MTTIWTYEAHSKAISHARGNSKAWNSFGPDPGQGPGIGGVSLTMVS